MRASPEEQLRRRPLMLSLYSGFFRAGDLVLDIGANNGDRSSLFLELGARVVAVEPQPRCAEILRERFLSDPRIDILETALGDRPGKARMWISNNDLVSSMSSRWIERVRSGERFEDSQWVDEVEVTVTTLDDIIARYGLPAFTKIDVEGYELQVLRGLSAPLPALSFEYTPEDIDTAFECLKTLESLGPYVFNISAGESMAMSMPKVAGRMETIARLEAVEGRWGQESGDIYAVLSDGKSPGSSRAASI